MRILIVLGAGASADCWPDHVKISSDSTRLPLANDLFSANPVQSAHLEKYDLMGLASKIRRKIRIEGDDFDIEATLKSINDIAVKKGDPNTLQNMFKARFYLHSLITFLTQKTIDYTNSQTIYVDMLNQLKDWIDEDPTSRYIDLVVFNYDNLIEKAMENVYNVDWSIKKHSDPMNSYYKGNNLKIYKPHGSINWGRKIENDVRSLSYVSPEQAFRDFSQIELQHNFIYINPSDILNDQVIKEYVPAIAIPFKGKADFQECPQGMQAAMLKAIKSANNLITLGWKGSDENFTNWLKPEEKKVKNVYVVSPKSTTELDKIYTQEKLILKESKFSDFINSDGLEDILKVLTE